MLGPVYEKILEERAGRLVTHPAKASKANDPMKKVDKVSKTDYLTVSLDKREIDKLKKEASLTRFTAESFVEHANNVNAASWNRKSGRLCYWCIEASCLVRRKKYWKE